MAFNDEDRINEEHLRLEGLALEEIAREIVAMREALRQLRAGNRTTTAIEPEAGADVVMVDECAPYTSGDWQWWALGCYMLPSK